MTFTFGQSSTTNTTNSTGGLFGAKPAATSSASTGFSFGSSSTTATTTTSGTGLFGTASSTSGTGLFGNSSSTSTSGGLFGNTSTSTSGGGLFGNTSSSTGGLFGNKPATGGLFSSSSTTNNTAAPANNQNAQQASLIQCAKACSQPTLFGDERDQIMAKLNIVQCSWGTGKAYYAQNQAPIELTPSNPFGRFKTVGYSCLPTAKDSDGLVWLICKKPDLDKTTATTAIQTALGNNAQMKLEVENVRKLNANQSEVTMYVKEVKPDGSSKRVLSSILCQGLNQQNIKSQLTTSIGLEEVIVRSALTKDEIKKIIATPPAAIDPVIWKQANLENPDKEKMIPVPMMGFKSLNQRLQLQNQMTEGHQNRNDIIQKEIRKLQDKQATTRSKIEERKRRILDLSHRVLEVIIQQEIQRKSGLAIQTEEEQLRTQLEALNNQLRAPTQFRGRINELLSSIRMQYEGDMRPISGPTGSLDTTAIADIQKHLKNQQEGINHMVELMKTACSDLEIIETGLMESEGKRF